MLSRSILLCEGTIVWGFPGDSVVKTLPAMQETQVRSLGQEDPLEEGMATHSSTLAGESHGQRSLAGYSPQGCKELDMTEATEHTAHSSQVYPFYC